MIEINNIKESQELNSDEKKFFCDCVDEVMVMVIKKVDELQDDSPNGAKKVNFIHNLLLNCLGGSFFHGVSADSAAEVYEQVADDMLTLVETWIEAALNEVKRKKAN